jgi:hypothetical protein
MPLIGAVVVRTAAERFDSPLRFWRESAAGGDDIRAGLRESDGDGLT